MGDAKASAEIETEYLMAKNKNNFDHPAENGVRIKVENMFTKLYITSLSSYFDIF
jgi:hypothetical protein